MRALTIQGSYVGSLPEMKELMDLVRAQGPAAGAGRDAPARRMSTRCMDELRAGKVSAAWC